MNLTEHGVAVQGISGPARKKREAILCTALSGAAETIEEGRGPWAWHASEGAEMVLEDGSTLSVIAAKWRGFAAIHKSGRRRISLSCPIVEAFDRIDDLGARAVAQARWAVRILQSPRTRGRNAAWVDAATSLATLCAMMHDGDSVSCTLDPGPSDDPIRIESVRSPTWRVRTTRAVADYVERVCPPCVEIVQSTGAGTAYIGIQRAPKVMCFAPSPDAVEGLRLMQRTGLDPEALFRV